jgi:hypothetical protein
MNIVCAGIGEQINWTCLGRANGDLMSQKVLPVLSMSAFFLLKIA